MGKGSYLGGHTVVGFGSSTKARGRRGGINSESPAAKQMASNEQKRREAKLAEQRRITAEITKKNVKFAKRLGERWHREKPPELYNKKLMEDKSTSSQLADAFKNAFSKIHENKL
ncbi:hypothetical protein GCM10011349_42710 [Novosphingobium indicum]|uniref:Uncharacterized protein n=1 Tax=Novosphingobium indicum TaxID=462949 RepID=A0ABQ2JZN4_9SPHN|nr:hypothetical protein [Novosphingobium indicum]GGN60734.1 hypothetical protein GCM10011349_42710 [Novosphingobium indicum]